MPSRSPFRAGDILACHGCCGVSRFIRAATFSPFAPAGLRLGPSHVALVVPHEGRKLWAESTTLTQRPCLIRERPVHGWQLHEIDDRLADYLDEGGRVDVYRLHDFAKLDAVEYSDFQFAAVQYWIDNPAAYDTPAALFSGSRLAALTRLYPPADLTALFCSEYIAAVLRRVHRLDPSDNPSRFNPARLLRELVRAGTYQRVRSITATAGRITP